MTRLEKLKQLETELREALDESDPRTMAPLVKQYRETLKEIEELEQDNDDLDEIARILANRQPSSD